MNRGLVLGFFDGVHIAHQELIRSAVNICREVYVITFNESPSEFFNKNFDYIYTRKESIKKIKALGVTEIVELDFPQIVNLTAEQYLAFIVQKYKPDAIFTGFDHTFGKNKIGNTDFLKKYANKYNYKYFCIPAQKYKDEIISSTLIRKLIANGKIAQANKLLTSNFCISGKVIHGAQIGRTLGFPTANIVYPQNIIKIPFGVYSATVNKKHGVLNWGLKPTVNNTKEPVAEIHILDFNKNIYNQNIKIEIIDKIRNEQKFNNLEELKNQINKDIEACLKL